LSLVTVFHCLLPHKVYGGEGVSYEGELPPFQLPSLEDSY
jgi:hypothetical protein